MRTDGQRGLEVIGDLRRIAEDVVAAPLGQGAAGLIAGKLSDLLGGWGIGVVLHEGDTTSVAVAPAALPAGLSGEGLRSSLRRTFHELSGIDTRVGQTPSERFPAPTHQVPILVADRVVGVLATFGDGGDRPDDAESILFLLAELLGPALTARARILPLAYRDPLTGLYNRRWLDDQLERSLAMARRRKQGVSVIMMDLDDFKRVNEALGHGGGDRVLRRVAETLMQQVRREDAVCRYGGDEFMALLPQTGSDDALCVAERLADAVGTLPSGLGESALALTFGLATSGTGGSTCTAKDLIERADAAMMTAKR